MKGIRVLIISFSFNHDMKKYLLDLSELLYSFSVLSGTIIVDKLKVVRIFGISASFGIIIMAMIYVFGDTSGTHINPAVTLSLALGKLMQKDVLGLCFK
jgi:aquaporin Z